jgi:hypothetical protein
MRDIDLTYDSEGENEDAFYRQAQDWHEENGGSRIDEALDRYRDYLETARQAKEDADFDRYNEERYDRD